MGDEITSVALEELEEYRQQAMGCRADDAAAAMLGAAYVGELVKYAYS